MSFVKFKKHLIDSISHPTNTQTDWIDSNIIPPTKPQILSWSSTDSKSAFEYLLNNSFESLEGDRFYKLSELKITETIQYYLKNPIEYKLNEYQFRSDEFSTKYEGNVFLGCSDTFGVGQRLEHTWPHILTQLKFPNDKIYNLGAPGSGSDTAFRLLSVLKDKIKIKNIFHWLPFRNRFEVYMGNDTLSKKINDIRIGNDDYQPLGYSTSVPHMEIGRGLFSDEYVKFGLSSNTLRNITDLKNILAIKQLASDLGVNYYISNFDFGISDNNQLNTVLEYFDKNDIPRNLLSRDLQHMPISDNAKVVSYFINQLDTQKNII